MTDLRPKDGQRHVGNRRFVWTTLKTRYSDLIVRMMISQNGDDIIDYLKLGHEFRRFKGWA